MKQRDILLILGSVCVFSLFWIIFSVYHNSITSTIPQKLATEIIPISPNFDTKTINDLKKRQKVTPNFGIIFSSESALSKPILSPTPSSPQPTPTPSPKIVQTSTESASAF